MFLIGIFSLEMFFKKLFIIWKKKLKKLKNRLFKSLQVQLQPGMWESACEN